MERKFTDDEIVKALGVCNYYAECDKCPFDGECRRLNPYALDLINRQKAEIERLKNRDMQIEVSKKLEAEIKTEAYKEFAEMLRAKSEYGTINVSPWQLDSLVNEMKNKLEENNNER